MSKHRMPENCWGWLQAAAWVGCIGLTCAGSSAQGQTGGWVGLAEPRTMLADQLVLVCRQMLAGEDQPSAAQYQCARIMLKWALELNEQDAELWRLWIELARQTGRRDDQMEGLRRYCRLATQDDAAQLQLILLSLEEKQMLEQRIAELERLADDPRVGSLSAALRSRLNFLAAQGWRELGNREKMLRRLKAAAELDRANVQAMRLLVDVTATERALGVELGVALVGLLRADPLDGGARRRLAELFLEQADYGRAAAQFELAEPLLGPGVDEAFYRDWVVSLIGQGRVEAAQQLLQALARVRDTEAKATTARAESGTSETAAAGGQDGESGDVVGQLPPTLEVLRAICFRLEGKEALEEASLRILDQALTAAAEAGDPMAGFEQVWWPLFLGRPVEAEAVQEQVRRLGAEHVLSRRLMGWQALQAGQTDRAIAMLEAVREVDPFARLGLARARGGAAGKGKDELMRLVHSAAGNPAAVLAVAELRQAEAGLRVEPTAAGAALARSFDTLPRSVREPGRTVPRWLLLRTEPQALRYRYLEPLRLTVEVQNMSDLTLAIGPDGAWPGRLFILPRVQISGQMVAGVPVQVEDLGRRLSLGPGEKLQVQIRLDRSDLGWVLASRPTEHVRIGGGAMVDPVVIGDQWLSLGPLSAQQMLKDLERLPMVLTPESVEEWLVLLDDPEQAVRMQAVAWLGQVRPRLKGLAWEALAAKVESVLAERFERMDSLSQYWTVRFLPTGEEPSSFAAIHRAAGQSKDGHLRMLYLACQIRDPGSDLLRQAMEDADEQLAGFARAYQQILLERQTKAGSPAVGTDGGTMPSR